MKKGYVALTVVIVLLFLVLAVGVVSGLTSASKIQSSKYSYLNRIDLNNVESCAEESLLRLNVNDNIPAVIKTGEIECVVQIEDHTGNEYTYNISYRSTTIRLKAQRTTNIYLLNWEVL